MAEWSMAVVLKTTVRETVPGVRIPLPPPPNSIKTNKYSYFLRDMVWMDPPSYPTFCWECPYP